MRSAGRQTLQTVEEVIGVEGDAASDRIAEIGEILALGLVRLMARKSSKQSDKDGESSLDFVAEQSGDRNRKTEKQAR